MLNLCKCACGLRCHNDYRTGHEPLTNFCGCACGQVIKSNREFVHGHQGKGKKIIYLEDEKKTWNNICQCGCKQKCKNKYLHGHYDRTNHILWNKGKTKADDPRILAVSNALKSRVYSPETLALKSVSMKKWWANPENRIGRVEWNRGLTKETDERVRAYSEALTGRFYSEEAREKNRIGHLGHVDSEETKVRRGASIRRAYEERGDEIIGKIIKNHHWTRFPYINEDIIIQMRSSWEVLYAQHLDKLGIVWIYESKYFKLSNGHRYVPDFFLPNLNEYHEVKGYLFSAAREKIELFKKNYPLEKLIVLFKQDLQRIGLDI